MGEDCCTKRHVSAEVSLQPVLFGIGRAARRAVGYKGIWHHASDSFVTIRGYKRLLWSSAAHGGGT